MYCVITIFIPLSSAYISKPKGTATKAQSFKKLRFFLRAFVSLWQNKTYGLPFYKK